MMSGVMTRGFEIAKQCVAEPLALLAVGAVLLGARRHWFVQRDSATKTAAAALAAFLVLAMISAALSENPEVAVFGGYYRREGLLAWVVYGAFFFAVLGWASSWRRADNLLDVLLLASVIPAAYAVQQRLGLDFYVVPSGELVRPGATLGSPVFLAAYLGILLPITAVRCWQARREAYRFALWLAVSLLQAGALLLTQTRGPLLALFAGMLLLACCAAGYARVRSFFFASAAALTLAAAALIAINTFSSARQWAQDVPVARRLVFDLSRHAGDETQRASASAAARLAIWSAGADTFAGAPLENKLLGYGPESASLHYFAHIPASMMRLIGHDTYFTFDRMHADALDIVLNFGALAWAVYGLFFCAVMYASARALYGLSGRGPPLIFMGCTIGLGAIFAAAAASAGLASAAMPAFGLGMGAGWFVFMVGHAYQALNEGTARGPAAGRWTLLAGLTAALVVFWLDAQINIPVLTTRLISFAIAALILITANAPRHDDAEADTNAGFAAEHGIWCWGIAVSLVAACASSFPISSLAASSGAPAPGNWSLRIAPMFVLMLAAALAARGNARRTATGTLRTVLVITLGLPLVYAAVHGASMAAQDFAPGIAMVESIAIASFDGPVFIFAMCVAFALQASWHAGMHAPLISAAARWSICAVAASILLVAIHDWRATRADVAATLALQASTLRPQLADQLGEEAIRLLPYERYYRRQLAFDLLGRAVAVMRTLAASPEQGPAAAQRLNAVLSDLAAAETAARKAVLVFPHDPWVIVTLANVLQIEALRVLRPLDPEGGARAAREADQLFERAHAMFPNQPLFLRNWAQLLADQGRSMDAYKLLDLMEKLIPTEPEAYVAKILIARQISDDSEVSETIERARRMLEPSAFAQLSNVANVQQR
ncbi:MAG: O-antigen ligase family protein [Burkholderiales bacterium]